MHQPRRNPVDADAILQDVQAAWEHADLAAATRLEANLTRIQAVGGPELAARACLGIARAQWRSHYRPEDTEPWVDHGLSLVDAEAAPLTWMRLTNFAAFLATERGAWAEAIPLTMAVRRAAVGRSDATGQALQATNNLAWVFWKLGDLVGARALLEEACAPDARPWFRGQALGDLVALCLEQGDHASAEARLAELEACPMAEPRRTEVLGLARARLFGARRAHADCRAAALDLLENGSGLSDERLALFRLAAESSFALGEHAEAMGLARRGLGVADAHPNTPGALELLQILAAAALEAGDLAAAKAALQALRTRGSAGGLPPEGTGVSTLLDDAGTPTPSALRAAQLEVSRRALERANAQLKAASEQANAALERRAAAESELRHGAMMEAAAQLAGGLAHRMNNLLTVIYDAAGRLQEGDGSVEARVGEILQAADEATAVVRRLQTLTLSGTRRVTDVDLSEALRACMADLQGMLPESFRMELTVGEAAWVRADPRELEHVVLNLALNACRATDERGRLEVRLRVEGSPGAGEAVLQVQDDGPGVPDEHREFIFQPFFSTRDESLGSGLGLPVSRTIVQQAGGTLRLVPSSGPGACFELRLPLREAPPTTTPAPAPVAPKTLQPARRVLLVEDERLVRAALRRQLTRRGYAVVEAENGAAGLDLWLAERERIDAVVTDVVMPELNGTEMAARILAEAPHTPVVVVSGYTARTNVEALLEHPLARFLAKPFEARVLIETLDELIALGERSTG